MKVDGKPVNDAFHPSWQNARRMAFVIVMRLGIFASGITFAVRGDERLMEAWLLIFVFWSNVATALHRGVFSLFAWRSSQLTGQPSANQAGFKPVPLRLLVRHTFVLSLVGMLVGGIAFTIAGRSMPMGVWIGILVGATAGNTLVRLRVSANEIAAGDRALGIATRCTLAGLVIGRLANVWLQTPIV
jgi:hypothetical protein